jgi:glycine dehydrogenase
MKFFVDSKCFPQTLAVLKTRAKYMNVELVVADYASWDLSDPVRDNLHSLTS